MMKVLIRLHLLLGTLFSQNAHAGILPTASANSLGSEDWKAIIKTYEGQIQDGGATGAALHNLALARFNEGEPAQAVAVWLAARDKSPLDSEILLGLRSSLAKLGFGLEALDLSAHGPVFGLIVETGYAGFMTFLKWAVTATLLLLLALILSSLKIGRSTAAGGQGASSRFGQFLCRIFGAGNRRLIRAVSILALCSLWILVFAWYRSVGHWGAVVREGGAILRSAPTEQGSELSRLKLGTPVYITGDTYSPWLIARNADGFVGWVAALDVRVVR